MKRNDKPKWILLFVLMFLYTSFLLYVGPAIQNRYLIWRPFTITAYCPGACCNDQWAGKTATGKYMSYYFQMGINIAAVDPKVIPFGSKILYNGKEYLCMDAGGAIKGHKIDLLFKTHAETVKFGVKKNQFVWAKTF
jgi:3D (Asp-Asp-Asp) domain-containing protein